MLGRVNFLSLSSSTQYFYHCCPAINIFIIAVHHSILCHCYPALNIFYHCCPVISIFIIAVHHSIFLSLLSNTQYFLSLLSSTQYFYHCCPPLNIFVSDAQQSVFLYRWKWRTSTIHTENALLHLYSDSGHVNARQSDVVCILLVLSLSLAVFGIWESVPTAARQTCTL